MADYTRALKNLNTVSWCTNSIRVVAWSVCVYLLMRNPNKMNRQTSQSVQMLIYHVSTVVDLQTFTLYILSLFDEQPDWFDLKRNVIINATASFLGTTCFVVAHWQFAFDYFRLSYKSKLRNDNLPVDKNSCPLDTSNYIVSAIIILLAAAVALTSAFEYVKLSYILFGILNSFLVLALVFLSYGLWVLTQIAKLNLTKIDVGMMSLHIVAYLLVILAVSSGYISLGSLKAIETT